MKRIYTTILLTMFTWLAFANEYTDKLIVTVNGESVEQQATITVIEGEDGKYTLSLNNFCLEAVEADGTITRVGVGNIVLPDREATVADGITTITYNDDLLITEGDDPDVDLWMGVLLGAVPIQMEARFNDSQLYCEIHINLMDLLGQLIDVVFGTEPEASAIHVLTDSADSKDDKTVYDLQGRKATSIGRHSLYIINGKKVIR